MTDDTKSQRPDLTKSTTTIRSDSENYDESNNDISPSPPSSSRRPMILYQPPTFWSLLRGAAINLLLPFVNGLMLGFGELLAHEAAFRLGWSTDKISFIRPPITHPCSGSRSRAIVASQSSWAIRGRLIVVVNRQSRRFASTETQATGIAHATSAYSTNIPQPVSNASPTAQPIATESQIFAEDVPPLDDSIYNSEPEFVEYIGYLKDVGLDYGWGPTSIVETLLEYVHLYTGTPWWASITLTVVLIRVVIFKFFIDAQDSTARMAAIKPLTRPLEQRQQAAMAAKDQIALRAVQQDRKALYKKHGVNMTSLFLPLILQVPLGFGTFRLIRGMAALPVPGFDQGGFWWLTDLTMPDPYFVFPLLTAAVYHLTFRMGGETGNAGQNMNPVVYKVLLFGIPGITAFFSLFWPLGLQIAMLLNGIFAITQNVLFRQPWFRSLCRIQPTGVIPTRDGPQTFNRGPKPGKEASKNMMESLKTAYSETLAQGKQILGNKDSKAVGRTDAEIKKAKAYEEKMSREAAQRRFEAKQAKEAREHERRQRTTLD